MREMVGKVRIFPYSGRFLVGKTSPNQPKLVHIHQAEVGEAEFGDYRQSEEGKGGSLGKRYSIL